MNNYIQYQEKLFVKLQKNHKELLKNLRNFPLVSINVDLINYFSQELISLTNDLQEINDFFKNNQETNKIKEKIKTFHLTNKKIQELLPYLILETI